MAFMFAACGTVPRLPTSTTPSAASTPASASPTGTLAAPAVGTVLMNGEVLFALRARLQGGDPALAAVLRKLVSAAGEELTSGPWSVMDKRQTPPGGDPHDYYSQSIYAWPNPKSADGLPWVTRDGDRNPAADAISDASGWRHVVDTSTHLALAWFYSGDPRYSARAALVLRTWFLAPATRMNANLRNAQRVPGVDHTTPGGIIDFADIGLVVDAAALLQGSADWSPEDESGFRDWLSRFLDWLRASPEGQVEARAPNNHSTWYDTQVASIAAFIGRQDLAKATVDGARARIDAQIRPDGSQPLELARATSWNYSVYNLRAFNRLAAIGRPLGIDLFGYTGATGASLRKAVDFLIPAATGAQPWTAGRQTTPFDAALVLPVLHAAADAGDSTASAAIAKVPKGGSSLDTWLLEPAP